jgi:hypothetical protein
MTIRRGARRASPAIAPESSRSYAEETLYSECENEDCVRLARTTCPTCGGEYCRWHDQHSGHDESAEPR